MLMPGMLTDEEMAALDKARGPEFDRLFLIGMIKHHQGADRHGERCCSAPTVRRRTTTIYKFASDVFADQSIEIERMQQMLESGTEIRIDETGQSSSSSRRSPCAVLIGAGVRSEEDAANDAGARGACRSNQRRRQRRHHRPPRRRATAPPPAAAAATPPAGAPARCRRAAAPPAAWSRRTRRDPAAAATAAPGGDAAAGRADRLGDRAVARSARGSDGRTVGRGRRPRGTCA